MPFFREFTKKVSQGSQEAVQKTRDMASILSWNADITDAEARIYDLEEDLGRAVFAENFEGMTKEQIQDILAMDESESLTLTISDWRPFTETLLKILEDKDLIADREKRIRKCLFGISGSLLSVVHRTISISAKIEQEANYGLCSR